MSEDIDDHECTPPDADLSIVFFTCSVDGRTWLRDPDDRTRWHETRPQDQ